MVGDDLAASVDEGKSIAELTEELIGARLDGMADLPRTVFLLRHLDGLEVAAIGERMGVTAEAVEGHLRQALDVLTWGAP